MVDEAVVQRKILALLSEEYLRLTPSDLERAVRREVPSVQRRDIRKALRKLVSLGSIAYSQHHSTTHLERNSYRAVQISEHIVLAPPCHRVSIKHDRVVIKLMDGTAFGGGDHPTTRLMLRGLDVMLSREDRIPLNRALDIGTGTGVLAIAAAALGFVQVDAVDIDPAACYQARQNANLNGVGHSMHISQNSLDPNTKRKYDLILANLRPPTMVDLFPTMSALSSSNALWLISGCRIKEGERLKKKLPAMHSNVVWQEASLDWAAFAVQGEMRTDHR